MKKTIITLCVIIAVCLGIWYLYNKNSQPNTDIPDSITAPLIDTRPKFLPRNQIKNVIQEYLYLKNNTITDTSLIFIEGIDSIPE